MHNTIIPPRLVNETIRAIVNSLLVPLADCYQKVQAGLGKISLTHWKYWESVISATTRASASPLLAMAVMTLNIRLMREGKFIVRLWICLFIVGYVLRRNRRSRRDYLLWREFVFHFCLVTHNYLIWYNMVSVHFGILEWRPLSLFLNEFGHWYHIGRVVNDASRHIISDVPHSQEVLYCWLHGCLEGGALKDHQLIDERPLRPPPLLWCTDFIPSPSCICEELHNGVLY